jgi:hypothetical protein
LPFVVSTMLVAGLVLAGMAEPADRVVIEWRFEKDGDLLGWQVAGQLKDVSVSGGVLRGEATGSDPILLGPVFEIAATPTQCVEIKMKASETAGAELFWTGTLEGQYGGFSQEKYNPIEIHADNQFHVYRLCPFWHAAGKIVRLRFDPPNAGKFEVAWIRVVDAGATARSDARAWKFDAGAQGWRAWQQVSEPAIADGVLRVTAQGSQPIIVSPSISADAETSPYVSVRMATASGKSGQVLCVSKKTYGTSTATFPLRADGRMHTYNVNMASLPNWRDEILLIGLRIADVDGAEARIESIAIADRPGGPPELELGYFGPAEGINRAGRPAEVTCTARNLGGEAAHDVIATLTVPAGVKILEPTRKIDRITCYLPKSATWSIESPRPGPVEVSVKLEAPGAAPVTATAKIDMSKAPDVPKATQVPEPRPVPSKYELGVFYFPGWDTTARWAPILGYPMRKPVLGWYDEANPECVDWQIKWAVEHGVRFFMVDWYWHQGNRQLEHWLHKGLMNAKHRRYMKWCVMWANHNPPGSHSVDDWRKVTQYWIDNYFGMEEYYRIDDRPAVVIWAPGNVRNDLGGTDQAAKLYAMSQEMAKKAGYKGVYFVAMSSHGSPAECAQLKSEGYEAMTSYHGFQLAQQKAGSQRFPFVDVTRYSPEVWRSEDQRAGGLNYYPIVDSGWSSEPWHGDRSLVIHDRTPEEFGKLCRAAREYADKTGQKIIAIGPWNEWGEGSYIEPYAEFGFGDLDQFRSAFCEPGDYPPNLIPSDVGLGPYDLPREPLRRAWDFDTAGDLAGWSPNGSLKVEARDGALRGQSTGADPILQGPALEIEAESVGVLSVRMKSDAADRAQLFWATSDSPQSERNCVHFDVIGDGEFHEYKVDLAKNPHWRGLIVSTRLDPVSGADAHFRIDWIKFQ